MKAHDNASQDQLITSYCDIGQHVLINTWVGACVVCDRRVCHCHQGNPDALAGDYVACPDHVEEVEAMNRVHWERLRRNVRGETRPEEETEDAG
jgi:hypothetical protein